MNRYIYIYVRREKLAKDIDRIHVFFRHSSFNFRDTSVNTYCRDAKYAIIARHLGILRDFSNQQTNKTIQTGIGRIMGKQD